MDYKRFKNEVQNRIRAYLPAEWCEWEVKCFTKYKINRKLDAITVAAPDTSLRTKAVYPVFYIQDLYDLYIDGNDIGRILRYVSNVFQNVPSQDEIQNADFSIDKLKDCVIIQLINYEKNEELLKSLPHRKLLDLAVIYRAVMFDEEGKWAGMLVNYEIMKGWGMTEKLLYERAYEHTAEVLPFLIEDIEESISEREFQMESPVNGLTRRMYLVSNDSYQFGASAMLYPELMEMASVNYNGKSFMILPGSVHELYLVDDILERTEHWRNTVKYANENLVNEEEWLSDNIYYYNSQSKTITIL